MKRLRGRSFLLIAGLAISALSFGCSDDDGGQAKSGGGTGPGGGGGGIALDYEATGEITGKIGGEDFVRYTVGANMGGDYINTAEWVQFGGLEDYRVEITGYKTKDPWDVEHAISINFSIDKNLELVEPFDNEPPDISYFPSGITFEPEEVFTMTDGSIELTHIERKGDDLAIRGKFSGTLHRTEWVDEKWGDFNQVEPTPIEGAFDIQKVSISTADFEDDD